MPTMASWAPISLARSSAAFSASRTDFSNEAKPPSPSRRGDDVDLDVEAAQLGLEGGIGDGGQHLGVAHRRLTVPVDEVELDLEARHRTLEVETGLRQHPGQHVEAPAHLLPVPGPVLAGELPLVDLCSHTDILAHRRRFAHGARP